MILFNKKQNMRTNQILQILHLGRSNKLYGNNVERT